MRIARPPGGFKISLSKNVKLLVDEHCTASEAFSRHWRDILDRLRFTAHVEGVEITTFEPGSRLWSAAADNDKGVPRVRIVYRVVGSVLHIRVASIG